MQFLFDNFKGHKANPLTKFHYQKENNILSFYFEAYDSSLYSYSSRDNDDNWKGCVVEIFLDLGDEFYYEFEVAPNGAKFVSTILNRKVTFIDDSFFKSNVKVEDSTYKVQMHIDLNKLNIKENNDIRFNAFRVETKNEKEPQILEALSPTLCETFHVRSKFVELK